MDPLIQPLITVSPAATGCVVRPTTVAIAVGATGGDIGKLATDPPATLMSCVTNAEGTGLPTPCSVAHRLEFVGGWKELVDDPNANALCDEPVREYTQRTFEGADQSLSVQLLQGSVGTSKQYRCAVVSRDAIVGTLWKHGNAPLTTA